MMRSHAYQRVINTACPGAFRGGALGNHDGLASVADDARRGHGLAVLRQPEQRLISSYGDGQHDWAPDLPAATSLVQYAEGVAGCTVKTLTRSGTDVCSNQVRPLASEVAEAVLRIENDFAFVGLTEEWYLSVCLFHAMFGGVARDVELMIVGKTKSSELYNTSELKGFTDRFDAPVYEKATQLFQRNMQLFGVSEDSCASILGLSKDSVDVLSTE